MRPLAAVGVALALWTAAPIAGADEPPQPGDVAVARDLFREASRLADEGNWLEAATRYEKSLALKRAPITLYSLGIAYQHLNRYVDAIENLRAFLVEPVVDATRPYEKTARDAIAEMEPKLAFANVRADDLPGVAVSLDGKPLAAASLGSKRPVDPGQHRVVARAAGYLDVEKVFTVDSGATADVELHLEPLPASPPIAPPVAPRVEQAPPPPPKRVEPTRTNTAAWALLGSGAGVFVVGVVVGAIGIAEANDAPAREGDEADAALSKALAGDVIGGIGLATAGAGAIWLIVDAARAPSVKTSFSPWVSPLGAGASATFAF